MRIPNCVKSMLTVAGIAAASCFLTACRSDDLMYRDARTANPICPYCEEETHTTAGESVKYTKHACPHCRQEMTYEYDYLRGTPKMVHVCDHCESVVEPCPICEAKMK